MCVPPVLWSSPHKHSIDTTAPQVNKGASLLFPGLGKAGYMEILTFLCPWVQVTIIHCTENDTTLLEQQVLLQWEFLAAVPSPQALAGKSQK